MLHLSRRVVVVGANFRVSFVSPRKVYECNLIDDEGLNFVIRWTPKTDAKEHAEKNVSCW